MSRETLALARQQPPSLVVLTKAPFLGRAAVRALRGTARGPVVMVYPDSPYGAYTQRADVLSVLATYDRVYIWGRRLLERLRADGITAAAYLPFAFDPADYGGDGPVHAAACGRRHAIAFVGQRYDKREAWLAALQGMDVGIWGTGWERSALAQVPGFCVHREAVHGGAAAAIYRGARLALNVLHSDNLPAHNMRTFEIPPCRTVMLTEATDEIAGFFPPGHACLAAAEPAELRREAQRVLDDPSLGPALAAEGARRAQPHTYAARSRAILADLGVAAPAVAAEARS
jgi:hypothetical protein